MKPAAVDSPTQYSDGPDPDEWEAQRDCPPQPSPTSPTDTWEPPVPLDALVPPQFPSHALPSLLRRYVEAVAMATQTPPDLAGLLSLTVISTALSKRVVVDVRPDWREPANIYVAVALPPGTRKSSVLAEVSNPLVEWERREMEQMAPVVEAAASERRVIEMRRAAAEKRAATAKDGNERAEAGAEARELSRELAERRDPVLPKMVVGDVTPEALASVLAEQGGRIAALSAEGELFAIAAGRYGDSPNLETFLKAHAGDDLRVDRRGRAEFVRAPALTIGLAVQPDVIRSLAERREMRGRGLLARFLYSLPPSTVGQREIDPPSVPQKVRDAYCSAVAALLALETDRDAEGQACEHRIQLSSSAREALHSLMEEIEPQLAEGAELSAIGDWAGKLAGAVVRIAALLHSVERAPEPPWKSPVGDKIMSSAIDIGRYLLGHARVAHALMGEDGTIEDARRVLRLLERRSVDRVTVRDAYRWAGGRGGAIGNVQRVEAAIQLLVEHGYLRPEVPPARRGAGRPPSAAFSVHPALHRGI